MLKSQSKEGLKMQKNLFCKGYGLLKQRPYPFKYFKGIVWDKVFKNRASKICGRQSLKRLSSTNFIYNFLLHAIMMRGVGRKRVFLLDNLRLLCCAINYLQILIKSVFKNFAVMIIYFRE